MRRWIKEQASNLFLWMPIMTALGMGLYFTIIHEPKIIYLMCTLISAVFIGIIFRKNPIIVLISCVLFGFGYAGIYTHIKSTIPLSHSIHNITITGTIYDIDYTQEKTRIYLQTDKFDRVRVSTKSDINLKIGDTISGNGGLFKPSPAAIPGGFDFARWMYFNNISGTGYIDTPNILDSGHDNLRQKIHDKSQSFLVDTLVLGYGKSLPSTHREVWATNGIAHIWSISGYHIGLITTWFFVIFYLICRSIPAITRRCPARIPALLCTWLCLIGYVILSGGGIAILRAFIMTSLVVLAAAIGRNIFSLRIISIAFSALILFNPHYVMTPGFQLSFAAIFGLVWLWSDVVPHTPNNKLLKFVYTAILSTLVAILFTSAFIALHFNTLPIYSLIGNIIFLPAFSFIIMPLVFVGCIFKLCGIGVFLNWADIIYEKLFKIASHIANMPHSDISTGTIPNTAIVLIILGLCCLIFIRHSDYLKFAIFRNINIFLCITFITLGIFICLLTPRPIFYISPDHNLIATVDNDGKLKFNKIKDSGNYFAFDTWKKSNREETGTPNLRLTKESGVYTISTKFGKIVYIQQFVPLSKNLPTLCADNSVRYIVSYFNINSKDCANKILYGGGVIYPSGRFVPVASHRLWHNQPE